MRHKKIISHFFSNYFRVDWQSLVKGIEANWIRPCFAINCVVLYPYPIDFNVPSLIELQLDLLHLT